MPSSHHSCHLQPPKPLQLATIDEILRIASTCAVASFRETQRIGAVHRPLESQARGDATERRNNPENNTRNKVLQETKDSQSNHSNQNSKLRFTVGIVETSETETANLQDCKITACGGGLEWGNNQKQDTRSSGGAVATDPKERHFTEWGRAEGG